MKLLIRCPACGVALKSKWSDGVVDLWCEFGRCPSVAANDGASALKPDLAAKKLQAAIEAEETPILYPVK